METSPVHTLTLTGVLSESKRIIRSNYTHFLTLSLFFLPISVYLIINPTLHIADHHHFTADRHPQYNQKTAINHLIYVLTVSILALTATATITFSTHHGFFNNPIDFLTAIKSLIVSFIPLVATVIVANTLLFLMLFTYLMLIGLGVMLLQTLGFVSVIDYNSIYFMLFSALVGLGLFAIVLYYHVNWSLAFVVVVVESKWGFSPLMRSAYLVKGMRSVSLSLLLFYGVLGGLLVYVYSRSLLTYGVTGWGVFFTVFGSMFLMMLLLQSTTANTVLYNYCKALHGELAIEVGEGFGYEYDNLAADDEKAPRIVTVVAP
ncbi:uncharacterized protein [Rutidosis leptorrhynchoides]|uniref:uncharacterized protein n=1 Tax=Rutidosis leptorrhynchoides TaxID=125765 RepID=UPI003A99F6F0